MSMMNHIRSGRFLLALALVSSLNSGPIMTTSTALAAGATSSILISPIQRPHQQIQQWSEAQQQQEQQERYLQDTTAATDAMQQPYNIEDEAALSFDGDVSFIQQLAMQKAMSALGVAGGGGGEGTADGTFTNTDGGGVVVEEVVDDSAISLIYPSSCESSDTNSDVAVDPQQLQQHHLEVLTWFYSMEYQMPAAAAATASSSEQSLLTSEIVQPQPDQNDNAARTLQLASSSSSSTTMALSASAAAAAAQQRLLAKVEQVLQLRLANLILVCANADAEFSEIVGEVSLPVDDVSEEQSCKRTSPDISCTNYDGKMNLFLSNGEKAEDAIYWGRKNVQAVMQDPSFLADVGLGLVSITYLGPDPVKPESGNTRLGGGGDGGGGGDDDPSSAYNNSFGTSTTLGTASIALMAIGGAVVMVFVASVFVWRRNRAGASMQHSIFVDAATATQGGGNSGTSNSASPILSSNLTISDGDGGDHGSERDRNNIIMNNDMDDDSVDQPTSPFSEMLPSAYRFNDNMSIMSGRDSGLSAVAEAAESSEEQVSDNSIAVSDSGFTNDAVGMSDDSSMLSFEMPPSLYNNLKQQHHDATTCATTVGTTTMAGMTQMGGLLLVDEQQPEMLSPAPLGARRRRENAITATLTDMANNTTSSREVSNDCDDVLSDVTCSVMGSTQAAAQLSSASSSMLQPKNLLAQHAAAFAEEGDGVDTSMADDEKMLFV